MMLSRSPKTRSHHLLHRGPLHPQMLAEHQENRRQSHCHQLHWRDIRPTQVEQLTESPPEKQRNSLGRGERRAAYFYILSFLSKAPRFNKNEIFTSYTYLIYWFKDESEEENSGCEPFSGERSFLQCSQSLSRVKLIWGCREPEDLYS